MMYIAQKQNGKEGGRRGGWNEGRPLEEKTAVITETSHPQAHETQSFPCMHNALSGWLTGWAKL